MTVRAVVLVSASSPQFRVNTFVKYRHNTEGCVCTELGDTRVYIDFLLWGRNPEVFAVLSMQLQFLGLTVSGDCFRFVILIFVLQLDVFIVKGANRIFQIFASRALPSNSAAF